MALYEVNKGSLQKHFVVASSYTRVEELWIKEYKSVPRNITLVSTYVIVDPRGVEK